MLVPQFKMWIGVVESRADPENLGRCKVRVLGYHTANTVTLPTKDLPWATVMMPVTSASMSGVSETPALLPGSTVVGFFADGDDEQNPVILGSLPGIPVERIEDPTVGFSDPNGKFPRTEEDVGYNDLNEPDLSRLARGASAEKHASLVQKREKRATGIPTAKAPSVKTVAEDISSADYSSGSWDEPHPRFGSTATGTYSDPGTVPTFGEGTTSVYPFNKVTETESGHVFEVDDTPGNGRIHEYHNSGSFYEIQADGTKVTKIVGDEYEIVIGGKNVSITGGCNVTIKGDCKLLVEGDMYEEIRMVRDANGKPTGKGGNKFTHIEGSHHTKIQGNSVVEIGTGMSVNVTEDYGMRVGKTTSITNVGSYTQTVGDGFNMTVTGGYNLTSTGNMSMTTLQSYNLTSLLNMTQTAVGNYRASGTSMSLLGIAQQKLVGGAAQLLETGGMQTINAGYQKTTAGARSITTGITQHTGMYSITGQLTATSVFTVTGVGLATHKHIAISLGKPTTPSIP